MVPYNKTRGECPRPFFLTEFSMKKSFFLLAASFVALSAIHSAAAFSEHDFDKYVTFTVSGYEGSSTLVNFPVLVRLSTDISGFDYSDFQTNDGSDLRFTDAAGNVIPHEIDTWDTTGTSLVWVKLPSLSGTATTFTAYYGSTAALDANDSTAVWSGYAGVWHLNDAAGASADSSGNGNSGTDRGNVTAETGVIGGAKRTAKENGNSNDKKAGVTIASSDSLKVAPTLTMSMWYKPRVAMDGTWAYLFATKTADSGESWAAQFRNKTLAIATGGSTENTSHAPLFNVPYGASVWTKLDVSIDGKSISVYTNGVLSATKTSSSTAADGSGLAIGSMLGNGYGAFNGDIDEARLYGEVRTADWIAAEYGNVMNVSFATAGVVAWTDITSPKFATPTVVRNGDGTFTFSVELLSGSIAGNVKAVFDDGVELTLAANGSTYTGTTAANLLAANTLYNPSVTATSTGGTTVNVGTAPIYTGDISIACTQDSTPASGAPVVFTVTRPTVVGDFTVAYAVDASATTATAGTHYTAPSGSVTIPDGSTTATIAVDVLGWDATVRTVALALSEGLYGIYSDAASATGRILAVNTTFVETDYGKRITFTVPGYTGSETLSDFPVLVRLSTAIDGFRYADLAEGGADLRFVDDEGNLLPYDIDTWDTGGTSLVWVKVPSLSSATTFYAYYKSANPTSMSTTSADVWSDYAGVWHFGDAMVATQSDATGHGLTATAISTSNSSAGETGIVGAAVCGAQTGGANNGGYLTPSYADYNINATFVASTWIKHIGTVNGYERVLSSKSNYDNTYGFEIEFHSGSDTTVNVRGAVGDSVQFTLPSQKAEAWNQVVFAYNGNSVSVYTNGALSATKSLPKSSTATTSTKGLAFGNNANKSEREYHGYFDEGRLRSGTLSADWIAAEYKNIADASFLASGDAENIDATAPVFETPTLAQSGGIFTMTVEQTFGTGDLEALYGNSDPLTIARTMASDATPGTYTHTFSGLTTDLSYRAGIRSENANGTIVTAYAQDAFYNGIPAVAKTQDGDEVSLAPVQFTVSRADTFGDLVVNYALGGTAVAGTHYTAPASHSVTIPDGASSAVVSLDVLRARDKDTTLTLTLTDGLYLLGATAPSATGSISMLVAPTGSNTWICPGASGLASVASNWSDSSVPEGTDNVLFDGRFSNADCNWDIAAPQTVASWTQQANYTGTVTFHTTYADANATFTRFTIAGNAVVLGGCWTHPGAQDTATYHLDVAIGGDFNLGADAAIDCRFKGFNKNKRYSGSAIAIHGGSSSDYSKARDSVYFPTEIGNGGNVDSTASRGGGAVWLEVAGNMTMDGDVDVHATENTDAWSGPGSGAPGSVYIKAKSLTGSGTIHAEAPKIDRRGTECPTGGRVAIYLTEATSLGIPWSKILCFGAIQYSSGAGTVFVKTAADSHGTLYVQNNKKGVVGTCGLNYHRLTGTTPIVAGETWTFDRIILADEGCLAVPKGTTLVLPNGFKSVSGNGLFCGILCNGGTITCGDADASHTIQSNWVFQAQQPFTFDRPVVVKDGAAIGQMRFYSSRTDPSVCDVTVNGALTVESTGYLWARGTSLANSGNFESDFNGRPAGTHCHGGMVGAYGAGWASANFGIANATYGSIFAPDFPGTHASGNDGNDMRQGGGYIKLTVNGALVMDGHAYADGGPYSYETSCMKGSGGALNITAASLSGTGTMDADGSAPSSCSGAESITNNFFAANGNCRNITTCTPGGRIAVKLTEGTFSDYWVANITAKGASRRSNGNVPAQVTMSSAGTVYLGSPEKDGVIYVRNDGYADNTLPVTPIPAATNLYASTDAVSDFARASLHVGDCGRVLLTESLKMRNATVESESLIDLYGRTLTLETLSLGGTKISAGTYTAAQLANLGFAEVADSSDGATGALVVRGNATVLILK